MILRRLFAKPTCRRGCTHWPSPSGPRWESSSRIPPSAPCRCGTGSCLREIATPMPHIQSHASQPRRLAFESRVAMLVRVVRPAVSARSRPAPPRLLMLLHGYFPDEPRVAAEARAAVDAGFEVDVVALRRPGEAPTDTVAGVRLRRLPVEHRRGGGLLRMVHEYAAFTLRAAMEASRRSSRGGYDVVQVHNPPDFLMLAAIVPRIRGARVILDVHDLSSDMFAMRF